MRGAWRKLLSCLKQASISHIFLSVSHLIAISYLYPHFAYPLFPHSSLFTFKRCLSSGISRFYPHATLLPPAFTSSHFHFLLFAFYFLLFARCTQFLAWFISSSLLFKHPLSYYKQPPTWTFSRFLSFSFAFGLYCIKHL